jgi:hypothetical protein
MTARHNTGPDYIGFFVPFLMMATLIYWLVN